MKKLLVLSAAVCALGANAFAMGISNPLFMPGHRGIMSDTNVYMTDTTKSDFTSKDITLVQRFSLNVTEHFQIGVSGGYARFKQDSGTTKDFTNPGAFAYFRILDLFVKADIGTEATFDIIDSDFGKDVNTYALVGRAGADFGAFSLGGIAKYAYNDISGADNNKDLLLTGFAIFDVMDIFGLGGEGTYARYSMGDGEYNGYELLARLDINPLSSIVGVKVYGGYYNINNTLDEGYKVGAQLRLAF